MVESAGGSTSGTTGSWALGCSLFRCRPCKWIWTIRQWLQSCDQKRFLHLTTVIVVTASFIRQHLENMGRNMAVRTGFDIQCKQQDAHFSKQFLRYLCQMWYEGTGDANGYSPSWHFCGKILARHSSTLPSPFVSNSQPPDTSLHAKGGMTLLQSGICHFHGTHAASGNGRVGISALAAWSGGSCIWQRMPQSKAQKGLLFLGFPFKATIYFLHHHVVLLQSQSFLNNSRAPWCFPEGCGSLPYHAAPFGTSQMPPPAAHQQSRSILPSPTWGPGNQLHLWPVGSWAQAPQFTILAVFAVCTLDLGMKPCPKLQVNSAEKVDGVMEAARGMG